MHPILRMFSFHMVMHTRYSSISATLIFSIIDLVYPFKSYHFKFTPVTQKKLISFKSMFYNCHVCINKNGPRKLWYCKVGCLLLLTHICCQKLNNQQIIYMLLTKVHEHFLTYLLLLFLRRVI